MRRVWQAGLVLFSSAHGLLSTPQHVFCFGDSLTVGSSPPETALFPYAPELEKALNAAPRPRRRDGGGHAHVRGRRTARPAHAAAEE
mmetsp:Transcript_28537/g.98194  ORF Transcript_28537/g.98194 Transcript_28537/m.98194 type:complete len:87 (-) Transcript_28537:366-626(-)